MSKISQKLDILKRSQSFIDPSPIIENLILEILGDFGRFPFGSLTLKAGAILIRVRPNETSSQKFLTRSELSYKPEKFNNTYQRASTPDQTMFYGALNEVDFTAIPNRVTPTIEAIPWLRDDYSKGKQKVTYSLWKLTKEINLIPIISHSPFLVNSVVQQFLPKLNAYINNNSDRPDEVIEFLEFIANEFATPHHFDNPKKYLISSIFTNILLRDGAFDGILYPSCRVDGETTNIALLPNTVDNKLDLTFAPECIIYKYKKKIHVANLNDSFNPENKPLDTFNYKPVDPKDQVPETAIFDDLGVSELEYR